MQFILRILPNASQFGGFLPNLLCQQFLPLEYAVDTYEKMEGLQRASEVELLAVLVNQDVESVRQISLGKLDLIRHQSKQIDVESSLSLPGTKKGSRLPQI